MTLREMAAVPHHEYRYDKHDCQNDPAELIQVDVHAVMVSDGEEERNHA